MNSAAAPEPSATSGERGAASVLALGILGATVALAVTVVPITAAFAASQRAAGAADAAALAAADALSGAVAGVPCELAGRTAERNGAALASCELGGPVASVAVTVPSFAVELRATARAGPPGWDP